MRVWRPNSTTWTPTCLIFLTTLAWIVHALPNDNNNSSNTPIYKIGVLFPDPASVRATDPTLNDMIVASRTAIDLASQSASKIAPDVTFEFQHVASDSQNLGETAWTTVELVESGINAVIGDMVSSMTQMEAGITGVRQIPQCSCASASLKLSNKDAYPYFFRTVGNVVLFGSTLVDWVRYMGWQKFALIYTNDDVGQQVLSAMVQKASSYNLDAMTQIPLYDMSRVEESLETLAKSGSRIVILADSTTSDQLTVLRTAMSMGLLSEGWVWMLTNDMSPAIRDTVKSQEELAAYDGLMFISGIWNLTGIPAYDAMQETWNTLPAPSNFTDPSAWHSTGLSYNAPNCYACAELMALGLNKACVLSTPKCRSCKHALDEYPGGRQKGLADLAAGSFNSSNMTPTFYNLNYTGPAGVMDFADTGDLQTGYFALQYMVDGSVVTYATLKNGTFEFENNNVLYLGHTNIRPRDSVQRYPLNLMLNDGHGIAIAAICGTGMFCCLFMLILILMYRRLKSIMVSSPTFCCIQLLGILMGYLACLMYVGKPNTAICVAREFIITTGFILVVGSLIAKSYRIYQIFQNVFTVRTSRLKSKYLLQIVAVCGLIAYIPLIVWQAVYPVQVQELTIGNSVSFCWVCAYPGASGGWVQVTIAELVTLIWCALLIIIAALLAYKTRKVRGKWAESNQIAYVSYNLGLAACLASPSFFLPDENYVITIHLKLTAIILASTCALIIIFVPKLISIARYVYGKHKSKLWRGYRGNRSNSAGYFNDAGYGVGSSSQENNNNSDNMATQNLLDFSVQAHEGVLPVKKVARFNYMSIWELKHVVVVPLKRFFILMNKQGHQARVHHYLACEPVSASEDRCIFRVVTDDNMTFLFQVHDQIALHRWLEWFAGPVDPDTMQQDYDKTGGELYTDATHTTATARAAPPTALSLQQEPFTSMHDQLATFGAAANTTISTNTTHHRRHSSSHYEPTTSLISPHGEHLNGSSDMLLHRHHDANDDDRDLSEMWARSHHQFPMSPTSFDMAVNDVYSSSTTTSSRPRFPSFF